MDDEERAARIAAMDDEDLTESGEPVEEAWQRANMLLDTVEDHELLDPLLLPDRLLYRLYHEDGVRAFPARNLTVDCRCSQDRIRGVLSRYEPSEFDDMLEGGVLKVRCEFCNKVFEFDPADIVSDN